MNYKELFNIAIDYILFNSNSILSYTAFISDNHIKDSKTARGAFINAYKKAVFILSH